MVRRLGVLSAALPDSPGGSGVAPEVWGGLCGLLRAGGALVGVRNLSIFGL